MKNFTCCLILLLFSFYSFSQSSQKLDSLKKVLAKLPKEGASFAGDTTRVRVLCEMGLSISNPIDSSIYYLQKGAELSLKIKFDKGNQITTFYLGKKNKTKGTYFEAITQFYKSLSYSEKLENDIMKAQCFQEIADSYSWLGEKIKCYSLYHEALKIYKKNTLYEEYADCLNNLALTYYEDKNYDKTIKLLEECITYKNYIKGKQSMPSFMSNLGSAFREKGEYDKALYYFNKSYEIQEKEKDGYREPYAILLIEMAKVYTKQKNFEKAIQLAEQALVIGKQLGGTQFAVNEVLYEVYKSKQEYNKALKFLENLTEANSNASKQDFSRRLNALKFEYDNEKKNSQISLLNENLVKEKLIKSISIIGVCMLTFFGVWFWRNNRQLKIKNNQIQSQQAKILEINRELEDLNKNLEVKVDERTIELSVANEELIIKNNEITEALFKGQTIERKRISSELHDNLGSTLSAMKWRLEAINGGNFTEKERKVYSGIVEMMKSAYSEVRNISHNLLPAEFEMKGLIGALEKLVNEINQNEKLYISFNFTNNGTSFFSIEKRVELELYSICLELLNNMLKHSKANKASIDINYNEDLFSIKIKDNGIGLKTSNQDTFGYGLKNINNRLQALNGKMFVESINGTMFLIEIPIKVSA